MPFRQLYYTSCETGLSGHSGFQFCAISPGVGQEITREVERLTVYEPPRNVERSGAELNYEDYPASLLYTHSEETGAAIIARTVYVGLDFSKRSGNYFAHTLLGDEMGLSPQAPLPIELWDAPFWSSRQGEMAELPLLPDSLPTGPICRESVSEMPEAASVSALGLLLTAMDEAVAGGPQILLVGRDVAAVCRWIAAGCYLLGPVLGPRLTFSTYSHDPRRCPAHVVGTVGRAGLGPEGPGPRSRLLDFSAGAAPDAAASPAASLLARTGVAASGALWNLMATLDSAPVKSLSASCPALATAALLLGHTLIPAEMDAAITWLTGAVGTLAAEHLEAAIRALLRHPLQILPAPRQDELVRLALEVDMTSPRGGRVLASDVECALVAAMLAQIRRGESLGEVISLRTDPGRDRASRGCAELLPRLDPGPALELLAWASEVGVRPADRTIRRLGQNSVLRVTDGGPVPQALERAAAKWPALRLGMLDTLATLPLREQETVLSSPVGQVFRPEDFDGQPGLHEAWLLISAQEERLNPVDVCARVVAIRCGHGQKPALDGPLISRLWPHRGWTAGEASQLIRKLPRDELTSEGVRQQCALILADGSGRAYPDDWMDFVTSLSGLERSILASLGLTAATELAAAVRLIRQARSSPTALDRMIGDLTALYEAGNPQVRDLLDCHLPPLILRHPDLTRIVAASPLPLHYRFCGYARSVLEREPHNISLAAWLYVVTSKLYRLQRQSHADYLDSHVLAPVLPRWSRRELAAVADEADRLLPRSDGKFRLWVDYYKKPRRFGRRVPRQGPD